jgi:hypothetical protein
MNAPRWPWWPGALLLAALACAGERPPQVLRVTTARAGADTRLTLIAAPGYQVSARLAPALELHDGTLIRFEGRRTQDSSYFAAPAAALLPGRHTRVHGTLRASVCREDERVCRSLAIEL